jgi:recombination associated protein RdgC
MGFLKGALSVRRYRVDGELPADWRERYRESLEANAFREAPSATSKEERMGWVQAHNLLDTGFGNTQQWLYNQYVLVALRIDKKTLPAKLFRAHLDKRVRAWCEEHQRERCPSPVKTELKEALELEMLRQTLPRVAVHEVCWNVNDGWVAFHNASDLVNDHFRKLFMRTFEMTPMLFDPLDFVADRPELAEALVSTGASDLRSEVAS